MPRGRSRHRPPGRQGGQFVRRAESSAGIQLEVERVRDVTRAEEHLAPGEHVLVVLVPAHAGAGPERVGNLRLGPQRTQREQERARQVQRSIPGSASANACSSVSENCPAAGSQLTYPPAACPRSHSAT